MNYEFNNDLVGKNRDWGKKEDLNPWKLAIYQRYVAMCGRCSNPNDCRYRTYGAVGIENHFTSLSHYYNTLKKDPLFDTFKQNPSLYHIDKDIKCGHGSHYAPDTVMIVLAGDNIREGTIRVHSEPVIFDGVRYESCKEAAKATGFSDRMIRRHALCETTSHFNKKYNKMYTYTATNEWYIKGVRHTAYPA